MRARNLKPGFFANPKLGKADPINGWVYQGLWCMADPQGYVEDDEEKIHGETNRFRPETSTSLALGWLEANGFIVRYSAEGKRCIFILEFERHQNPHFKEKLNKLPRYQPSSAKPQTNPVPAPDQPGANPRPAPEQPKSSREDSGFLIPDPGSLIVDCGSLNVDIRARDRAGLAKDLDEIMTLYAEHAQGLGLVTTPERLADTRSKLTKYTLAEQRQILTEAIDAKRADLRRPAAGRDGPRPEATARDVARLTEDQIYAQVGRIKGAYPAGAARQDWLGAEHTMRNLVDEGAATWDSLLAGVQRYAKLCRTTGRLVLNPVRFFGDADRPWSQDWPLPVRVNGNGHAPHDDSHQSRTAPEGLFDPEPDAEGAYASG